PPGRLAGRRGQIAGGAERADSGADHRQAAVLGGRSAGARAPALHAGPATVPARAVPVDVPRPAVDRPAVRRVLHRLRDLFRRLPTHPPERLDALLPDRWAAVRAAAPLP